MFGRREEVTVNSWDNKSTELSCWRLLFMSSLKPNQSPSNSEIKQNQSIVLFPRPWNLFYTQCFAKVQTPMLFVWAWPSPDTWGVCRCVIDSAGPCGSKYHWGVNSPGGLLKSYSSISLFSPHWVNETACFLPCDLREHNALRAEPWGLCSF